MSLRTSKDATPEAIQDLAERVLVQAKLLKDLEDVMIRVWGDLEAGSLNSELLMKTIDRIRELKGDV